MIFMVDTLIFNGLIITMDSQRRIIKDGAIAIEGKRILDVGKSDDFRNKYKAEQVLDANGGVIIPGLVDAHVHVTGEALAKGFVPDNYAHNEWLVNWIIALNAAHSPEDEYISTLLSSIEMIKTGTTSFLEAGCLNSVGDVVRAIDNVGIKGILGRFTWDLPPGPPEYSQTTGQALSNIEQMVEKYNGSADGRVKTWASVVGHTTCSDELLIGAKKLADRYGVGINMHMSPVPDDAEGYLKSTGKRPVEHFEDIGILDKNLAMVHMVHLSDKEVNLLKKYDVKVVHCPATSLRLVYGITKYAKFPEMLQQGICVSLGCDGHNDSNYFDLLRVVYLVAGIYKDCRMDVNMIPAEQALEMATVNGARALMMEDEIGSIEKGKKADVVIFDTKRPEWVPMFNPVNSLVYSADGKSVDTVLIDGKVVLEKGKMKTLDEFEVYEKAQQAGSELIKRAGLPLETRWKTE
jgi:cytosine/adenosine deaminase-related metal-dependent hydrolase